MLNFSSFKSFDGKIKGFDDFTISILKEIFVETKNVKRLLTFYDNQGTNKTRVKIDLKYKKLIRLRLRSN